MRKINKLISFILVLVFIFSALPISAIPMEEKKEEVEISQNVGPWYRKPNSLINRANRTILAKSLTTMAQNENNQNNDEVKNIKEEPVKLFSLRPEEYEMKNYFNYGYLGFWNIDSSYNFLNGGQFKLTDNISGNIYASWNADILDFYPILKLGEIYEGTHRFHVPEYFKFIPEESGAYIISMTSGNSYVDIQDENFDNMYYEYFEDERQGIVVDLQADKTYYISTYANYDGPYDLFVKKFSYEESLSENQLNALLNAPLIKAGEKQHLEIGLNEYDEGEIKVLKFIPESDGVYDIATENALEYTSLAVLEHGRVSIDLYGSGTGNDPNAKMSAYLEKDKIYYIIVAYEDYLQTGNFDLVVNVAERPAELETAPELFLDQEQFLEVEVEEQYFVYKFIPEVTGTYYLWATRYSEISEHYIKNNNLKTLAIFDTETLNKAGYSYIPLELIAGETYYWYSNLTYSWYIDEYEIGITMNEENLQPQPIVASGNLNYEETSNISYNNDVLILEYNHSKDGYVNLNLLEDIEFNLTIKDDEGYIEYSDLDFTEHKVYLQKGTYYLFIEIEENGNYTLCADLYYYVDELFETATEISLENTVTCVGNYTFYYKFVPEKTGTYQIYSSSSYRWHDLYIYNNIGQKLIDVYAVNSTEYMVFEAGRTYYMSIEANYNQTINVRFTFQEEITEIKDLIANTSGELTFSDNKSIHYYKFTPDKTAYYSLITDDDVNIVPFNEDGTVYYDDYYGIGSYFDEFLEANKTYYFALITDNYDETNFVAGYSFSETIINELHENEVKENVVDYDGLNLYNFTANSSGLYKIVLGSPLDSSKFDFEIYDLNKNLRLQRDLSFGVLDNDEGISLFIELKKGEEHQLWVELINSDELRNVVVDYNITMEKIDVDGLVWFSNDSMPTQYTWEVDDEGNEYNIQRLSLTLEQIKAPEGYKLNTNKYEILYEYVDKWNNSDGSSEQYITFTINGKDATNEPFYFINEPMSIDLAFSSLIHTNDIQIVGANNIEAANIFRISLTNINTNNTINGIIGENGLNIKSLPVGKYLIEVKNNFFNIDSISLLNRVNGLTLTETEDGYILDISEDIDVLTQYNLEIKQNPRQGYYYEHTTSLPNYIIPEGKVDNVVEIKKSPLPFYFSGGPRPQ